MSNYLRKNKLSKINIYIIGYILSKSFQNTKYVLNVCSKPIQSFIKLNH